MPLIAGDKLGPYEIISLLGKGGMGEVYRARDPRLNRDVAIKVLAPALAADSAYLARFEREAQTLAALNHPYIAAIYGLEQNAIVMELVEGPTLADKLAAGPVPLADSVSIAKQIAEALEAAHEKNIVHRDLKPANVKLTAAGSVKVLDFGLAKTAELVEPHDASNSPTMSLRATQAGVILGTAGYMAPEQAAGKSVDKRADIWSYGVVLWEMLTGRRMFEGETVTHTLAAVLTKEPDLKALPPGTPANIRTLLTRVLDRDPRTRLRDIGEARILLERPIAAEPAPAAARPSRLIWLIAAIPLLAFAALAVLHFRETSPPKSVIVAELPPPEDTSYQLGGASASNLSIAGHPVLSPDGKRIAFTATSTSGNQLWVRNLDASAAQPLNGTTNATHPFWSPDSRYIGFFADLKLKKIDTQGGPPIALADAPSGRGGSWSSAGVIIFCPSTTSSEIRRISAGGGEPSTVLSKLTTSANTRWPWFLPDGSHFLITSGEQVWLASLDNSPPRSILNERTNAIYAAGHLLFMRESALMAQPFDPASLSFQGEPRQIAESVLAVGNGRRGVFSASDAGQLLYMGGVGTNTYTIDWFERDGRKAAHVADFEVRGVLNTRLSPDNSKLLAAIYAGSNSSAWIIDLTTSVKTLFREGYGSRYAWSHDSKGIFFNAVKPGQAIPTTIMRQSLSLLPAETVFEGKGWIAPSSASPDGKYLLVTQGRDLTAIGAIPLTGKPAILPLTTHSTDRPSGYPVVSPDGNWLVYSDGLLRTGNLIIRPFKPESPLGPQQQITTGGGTLAYWAKDMNEIIYYSGGTPVPRIHSLALKIRGGEVQVGTDKVIFNNSIVGVSFTVTSDGKRAIIAQRISEKRSPNLTLIHNWTEKLK